MTDTETGKELALPSSKGVVSADQFAMMEQAAAEDAGAEFSEGRTLPALQVAQKGSDELLAMGIPKGSLVLTPGPIPIAGPGMEVPVVPLFRYREWQIWRDFNDKEGGKVQERTTDPDSEIAIKARNEATRDESYGDKGKYTRRYCEVLVYIVSLYGDHELAGNVAALEFASGSFRKGAAWQTLIQSRRVVNEKTGKAIPVAPYMGVYMLRTVEVDQGGNKNFVPVVRIPQADELQYVNPQDVEHIKKMREAIRADFEGDNLKVSEHEDVKPKKERAASASAE